MTAIDLKAIRQRAAMDGDRCRCAIPQIHSHEDHDTASADDRAQLLALVDRIRQRLEVMRDGCTDREARHSLSALLREMGGGGAK